MDLSNNELSDLPNSLSELKKLDTLVLSNNRLKKIPKVLFEMPNLKALELESNSLLKESYETIKNKLPNIEFLSV